MGSVNRAHSWIVDLHRLGIVKIIIRARTQKPSHMPRLYDYVGPPEIRDSALSQPSGVPISSRSELANWLRSAEAERDSNGSLTATFIVDGNGLLCLAPRRSEHVACAAGGPVLSAGEITFSESDEVLEISNQSTGFCPEPESWPSVARALEKIPIAHPGSFTTILLFRRCPSCNERNVVKDGWYVCEICGADLPKDWNFSSV